MPSRKILRLILTVGDKAVIRSGTVVYLGSSIGKHFETGHNVVIREENIIGDNVRIWSNTIIDYKCRIGNGVKIHANCYIAQLTVIGDNAFLAPGVVLANEKYPTGTFSDERIKAPIIGKGVKIGVNATILPGVIIGENSLIGAGSVVTKSVPPNSVAYGVPAKVIKSLEDTCALRK